LVGIDGGVLNDDFLLASVPVVVKPLGQHHHRPCGLVGKREIFRVRLEILCRLRPSNSG
jgi:hypothetical protein